MIGSKRKHSLLFKLGLTAATLLLGQQAFAVGTVAGTDVDNIASVNYAVNGTPQQVVESAPGVGNAIPGATNGTVTTFMVDNRVDFSLTQIGGVHTSVVAGETDAFVEFLLSNVGNSVQDFNLSVADLIPGDIFNALDDTGVDLDNLRIRVGVNSTGGGTVPGAAPTTSSPDFADELPADENVTIYVFGDASLALGLVNNDVANIDLSATVAQGGTAGAPVGANLSDDVGNPNTAGVEVVFAEGGVLGDGIEIARGGYLVSGAGLTVTKEATVISDPFNSSDFKAIPGAVIEYLITVENAGNAAADATVITDAIDTDVNFVPGAFAPNDMEVINNGGAALACIADGDDSDGCTLIGGVLTVGSVASPVSIAAGTTLTLRYQVTIP